MQIKFDVLCPVVLAHTADVVAFIAGVPFKRDGKRLNCLDAVFGRVVQY